MKSMLSPEEIEWADLKNDIFTLRRIIKEVEWACNNMKTPPLKLFGIKNYLIEQYEIRKRLTKKAELKLNNKENR